MFCFHPWWEPLISLPWTYAFSAASLQPVASSLYPELTCPKASIIKSLKKFVQCKIQVFIGVSWNEMLISSWLAPPHLRHHCWRSSVHENFLWFMSSLKSTRREPYMPNSALGFLEHLQLVCCCPISSIILKGHKFGYHQFCNLKGPKISIQEGQICTYAVMPMLVAPKFSMADIHASKGK